MKFLIFASVLLVLHLAAGQIDVNCYTCGSNNPCGQGKPFYFFRYCPNPSYYVQCGTTAAQCYYKFCPYGTVWNQVQFACVRNPSVALPTPGPSYPSPPCPTGKFNCQDRNPCTVEHAANGSFHFDHVTRGMFVQCDNFQKCFQMNCPPGEVWETVSCSCVRGSV